MLRNSVILKDWLGNRSIIEFIGLWEQFNNPNFNSFELDGIKNMSGSNSTVCKFQLYLIRYN
jgi:hypothetical protein